jgi:hypothetical protein
MPLRDGRMRKKGRTDHHSRQDLSRRTRSYVREVNDYSEATPCSAITDLVPDRRAVHPEPPRLFGHGHTIGERGSDRGHFLRRRRCSIPSPWLHRRPGQRVFRLGVIVLVACC